MADDITLTVRVRDMTRGEFQRLEGRLQAMKRELRGVDRSTDSAGMHSKRLGQDIDKLNNSFKKMEQTGRLSRRELAQMKNTLDAMSRSALNAARHGEITSDKFRSINDEVGRLRSELNRLDHGLNNNNNTMRTTIRMVNGVTRSVTTNSRSVNGNTRVINTWRNDLNRVSGAMRNAGNNGTFVGKTFGNMRSKLIGTAVVLIASLLPTIGALAPMLAGIGAMAGVAALAFSGLSKPTRMLGKDEKEFLKALKPVKKEFEELQKTARHALLPQLTKSFGDMKGAVKALNPVIQVAGDAFGKLVQKIAKGISSKDFMGPFLQNVKMGTKWVLQFAGSIGTFTKAFFEFGTKSQKSLDAWQNLLGGFLDRGLPSMFKNMETGISGASDWLNGLAYLINDSLLPSLGKLLAAFMRTFGPFLEQLMHTAGGALNAFSVLFDGAMIGIQPIVDVVTDSLRAFNEVMKIGWSVAGDLVKVLGGALLGTLAAMTGQDVSFAPMTGSFKEFSNWVETHQQSIRAAFVEISLGIIDMVNVGVQMMPILIGAFTGFAKTAIQAVVGFVDVVAGLGSKLPGAYGQMFRDMKKSVDETAANWTGKLDKMATGAKRFADAAGPQLSRAKLVLNVSQAKANLDYIKGELEDPKLTKERKAQLTADKSRAEAIVRAAEDRLAAFDGKKSKATLEATASPYFSTLGRANAARLRDKSALIKANPAPFWSGVRGLLGRVLGTSYINVQRRMVESSASPYFKASGGVMKFFANGGREDHRAQIAPAGSWRVWGEPETGGEAYIPLSPTKRSRSRDIAETTVGMLGGEVEWFARGGTRRKKKPSKQAQAEQQARSDAVGELTISHFGKMAGYKNDEFRRALGLPEALGSLVDSLNHWRSVILKATHGGLEKHLLKQLDKAGRSLIKYDKKLNKVNDSLDKAKTKLSDLKQAAASLRESVTSGVMSATDITGAAQGDKNVTMSDIMTRMRESVDKSSAFANALAALKKRGVSGTVIAQIAQAGIEGGGLETAGALLQASDSEIKTLNEMQKKINKSAKDAGKTAADAMYAAGIKAAQGLVDGLTKKKKDIEKAMMNIAKAMEKAIKRALKIHSPSQVMQEVGHYTAEGFAIGIKKNPSVDTAWASMLNTGTPGRGASSGVSSGNGPQVIQVYVGNKMVDEIVLDSGRRVVRTRGGNVQAVFGARTS